MLLFVIVYTIVLVTGCGNIPKPENGYFVEAAVHHDTRYWVTYKDKNDEIRTISIHKSKITKTLDGFTVWYDNKINVSSSVNRVVSVNKDSPIKKEDF